MRRRQILLLVVWLCGLSLVASGAEAQAGRVLNNLVTELTSLDQLPLDPYQEFDFSLKRDGWVFVSCTATSVRWPDTFRISIDRPQEDAIIVHRYGDRNPVETMRFIARGEHKLRVWYVADKRAEPRAM